MHAKDNHLTSLHEKLKQTRGITISLSTPQDSKTKLGLLNEELQKLRDAIAAHQQQNSLINNDFQRLKKENVIQLLVKNESILRLEKELDLLRQDYQDLRFKLLSRQGASDEYLSDLDGVKQELFYSIGRQLKVNRSLVGKPCNHDLSNLYEQAKHVPYQKFNEWLEQHIDRLENSQ